MFVYNLRLAWLSTRKNLTLTGLMIGAIALGIGVCMSMLTVYMIMSGNPIPSKSDELFSVRVDNWDPDSDHSFNDHFPDQPPWQHTYRDALALLESPVPLRQVAMFKSVLTVRPDNADVQPYRELVRMTTRDFFAMFDVPFIYGGTWDAAADNAGSEVVVLSKESNDKLFDGEDSVGRRLTLEDRVFTIVGVIDDWNPIPKFYDVNNNPFEDSEPFYAPFSMIATWDMPRSGNTNCWKAEDTAKHEDFLGSECVWIQFWAELPTAEAQRDYSQWLDGYVREQQALGRLLRPLDNRIDDVPAWLDANEVVRNDSKVLVGLAFMFLMVCVFNTVGLLLARFVGKAPVIGLRRALGASKLAVFRQHLIEVGLIGFAGGLLGLVLTAGGLEAIKWLYEAPERMVALDWRMVGITLGVAIGASLAAGLYPTWQVCRLNPARYLKTQ